MNILEKIQNKEIGLLIQRITIGFLILFHGIANMNSNYSFIKSLLSGLGLPEIIAYAVFIGEIIAPILIIIGYRARLASLILAFNMLFAILMAHTSEVFSINKYGGWAIELQALYLFGAITILFIGAGKYAIATNSKWD
ncbi:DoxX family protein [uncultured Tenacibaculum sp.]|uniref:DoxX family protein n=1 Tax=uncultured Tenacibaculum sp. TaxID=174713 RepID=UPI00260CFDC8|nr:DoxX family protein [uncultured Tenacibaculum sp.]